MADINIPQNGYGFMKDPAYDGYFAMSAQYGKAAADKSGPSDTAANTRGSTGVVEEQRLRSLKKAGLVECQTCRNRKYQDGSNDSGVSFKAPGHIAPEASAAMVMSHEQEHVTNEKARAENEGRKVVSQSVSLYTSVCPECGRTYVSGGITRTVTAADGAKDYFKKQFQDFLDRNFGRSIDTKV